MGSTGVCPLTVIATIPDICRHMSNLIARAQHEVFLATNFWKVSEGSRLICNSLKELSRRAVLDNREVVVKIMYDRGSPKQIINNHQYVPAKVYADENGAVRIPPPQELPNVRVEIVNYHKPPLGTFHAKFMIVDRQIAILQSNNIQDNDNLEMMTQFEGPIVDALYDMALLTWKNPLHPQMPLLGRPAAGAPPPTFNSAGHRTMYGDGQQIDQRYSFAREAADDPNIAGRSVRTDSLGGPDVMPGGAQTLSDVAIQATHASLPPHTSGDPHYDEDISKEVLRAVAGFIPGRDGSRMQGITNLLNVGDGGNNTQATAPEVAPQDIMTPMIPIPRHDPFPIAMVCREPYGPPTNASVHVPQNAAFISALRNATKSVFIQTPNLNAAALLPEIVAACRRRCHVTYYYCLGYNDAGELLPMQGGHNESVAHNLLSELGAEYHQYLDIYCYVAKDQVHPIHNKFKKRSCHIKLLIADDHIGIQGSGNQDTQSWYHSQEVNVMIDSPFVCGKWIEGIRQNQNTHIYGLVEKTGPDAGCWKDPQTGKQADGAIGVDAGSFAWAYGIKGALARVQGKGGF